MKKTILLAGVALSFIATDAKAFYIEADPYVGFDYTYSRQKYASQFNDKFKRDNDIFTLTTGVKTDYCVGLEAFLQRSNRETQYSSYGKYTTNHIAFGVDLLGYYPVYMDLDLIGGIGIGSYYFRVRDGFGPNSNKHAYGTRFTLGTQYNLDENWGVRATYRYIKSNQNSFFKSGNEYTLGVRYTFK
ncbi:MAG: outer membrane beta-barrel protein [Alphaproteobacteria bacterium]|nr:outer membrane beta-barrel protein [Alphaproteobacteria bacterium]